MASLFDVHEFDLSIEYPDVSSGSGYSQIPIPSIRCNDIELINVLRQPKKYLSIPQKTGHLVVARKNNRVVMFSVVGKGRKAKLADQRDIRIDEGCCRDLYRDLAQRDAAFRLILSDPNWLTKAHENSAALYCLMSLSMLTKHEIVEIALKLVKLIEGCIEFHRLEHYRAAVAMIEGVLQGDKPPNMRAADALAGKLFQSNALARETSAYETVRTAIYITANMNGHYSTQAYMLANSVLAAGHFNDKFFTLKFQQDVHAAIYQPASYYPILYGLMKYYVMW